MGTIWVHQKCNYINKTQNRIKMVWYLKCNTNLDDKIGIVNFYCVANEATKDEETEDFERYKELRDSEKKHFIFIEVVPGVG